MGATVVFVALGLWSLMQSTRADLNDTQRCLPGPYHKFYASPETDDFPECHAFADNSCCQVHIADEIFKHGAKNLYEGYHWDRCGALSDACRAFIADEECFYQCEPSLWHFKDPAYPGKGYVKDIPICASYCDAWFDACRNDKTCVVDWLNDFNATQGEYHCPDDSTCKTFAEVYENGKGLCNTMWGNAFTFETDETKCMLMHFDQSNCRNPNDCARDDVICDAARYEGCGCSAIGPIVSMVTILAAFAFYAKS